MVAIGKRLQLKKSRNASLKLSEIGRLLWICSADVINSFQSNPGIMRTDLEEDANVGRRPKKIDVEEAFEKMDWVLIRPGKWLVSDRVRVDPNLTRPENNSGHPYLNLK